MNIEFGPNITIWEKESDTLSPGFYSIENCLLK